MQDTKPPFVREYEDEGVKLAFNTGAPIKANLVYKFLLTVHAPDEISQPEIESFLILEGHLYSHELDNEKYPSLAWYLNTHKHKSGLGELWESYQNIESNDIGLIQKAFYATRIHAAETMKDLSEEEKKSALTPKSENTSKPPKNRATATRK